MISRDAVAAIVAAVVTGTVTGMAAAPAWAQNPPRQPSMSFADSRSPGATEGIGGYAGFVDESMIEHLVVGVAAPMRLSDRLSVGPELLYMDGPGDDRDVVVAGILRVDLGPAGRRGERVVPFVIVGGGWLFHRDRFSWGGEPYVGGGGGARVWLAPRLYIAPEVQLGWELHIRTSVRVGYTWAARRVASRTAGR